MWKRLLLSAPLLGVLFFLAALAKIGDARFADVLNTYLRSEHATSEYLVAGYAERLLTLDAKRGVAAAKALIGSPRFKTFGTASQARIRKVATSTRSK